MRNEHWYKELPNHIQKQFKKNVEATGGDFLSYLNKDISDDPYQFIDYAFTWDSTPEGDNYWCDLAEMLRDEYISDADFEAFYERHPDHSKRDEVINNYEIY
jgi:hypothetical protein